MDANVIVTFFVGVISTAAVLLTGFFSIYRLRKQHQTQGLLEAFRILDTTEHRGFRRRVFEIYLEYLDTDELKSYKQSPDVESVRADFDVMGKLVRSKNIDKDDFLEEYGPVAYRCWKCLEADIKDERKSRNFKPFMRHFQWLARQSYNYWMERGENLSETKLYRPDNPDKWIDFQKDPLVSELL